MFQSLKKQAEHLESVHSHMLAGETQRVNVISLLSLSKAEKGCDLNPHLWPQFPPPGFGGDCGLIVLLAVMISGLPLPLVVTKANSMRTPGANEFIEIWRRKEL